ncbi:MAG: DUF401 family protein [Candidatus Woesearchaeota archaeon]|jgi:hypothetical protein|nr:DUF401 family protein [Candidatus Woesearchaeota archaeon]
MYEILKLSLILIVMIIIIARKLDLIYAILSGIILTGFLFNHSRGFIPDFTETITDFKVINILIVFYFVFYLSNLLTDAGILKKMLASLEKFIKDIRFVIISLPLMIGIVPAPSGAMLSAPFVNELGDRVKLSPTRKLIINYWYRHVTEYLNPIYPGPIILTALLGITFTQLFTLNIPIMLFVIILGFFMFVINIKSTEKNDEKPTKNDLKNILNGILPIFIAILLPIIFKINISISLIVAILLIIVVNKLNIQTLKPVFKKAFKPNILVLIFLIMYFKVILENSKAVELVSNQFITLGFPPIFLIILLPLVVGFMTGMTIAYVGLAFPLLIPLMQTPTGLNMSFVMLAYVAGFVGVLATPTHLCFSVTKEYFKAPYTKLYKKLLPALTLLLTFAIILALFGWSGF